MIKSCEVTKALFQANTAGKKAAATKLLNKYVEQKKQEGRTPVSIRAGIKAQVTKMRNSD